jgi:hypothetical protein
MKHIKKFENFDSNYLNKLNDVDKNNGQYYIMYNKDTKNFRVENDTHIVNDGLSFDEIKTFMNTHNTIYNEVIQDLSTMDDFIDFQKVVDMFTYKSRQDKDILKFVKYNYLHLLNVVKKYIIK